MKNSRDSDPLTNEQRRLALCMEGRQRRRRQICHLCSAIDVVRRIGSCVF